MPQRPEHFDTLPVVITGVGLATCLGRDANTTWQNILARQPGMAPMSEMESALPAGSTGGQAVDLPADFRADLPREARYLRWTIVQALKNAGIEFQLPADPSRCAVMLGTTLQGIRAGGRFLRSDDISELRTFLAGATASLAVDDLGLRGGTVTVCSACSSSLGAIVQGAMLLQAGKADLVVAGGYDVLSEYAWAGFNALRLVAKGSLRPFCRDRQGMKIAEGYGIVILERAPDAAARNAPVSAVLAGWGESADAHHLTQPHPLGEGALRAMKQAVARAGIDAKDIGMIAAHATGTPDNDASEYQALARLLGHELPRVPVVGFKSHLGHTLGGAGAVELVLSTLALRDQVVPPCAGIASDEIEFPALNVATGLAQPRDLRFTLNTSLGFGGANTSVVLQRTVSAPLTSAASRIGRPGSHRPEAWITGIGVLLPGCIGNAALCEQAVQQDQQSASAHPTVLDDAAIAPYLNVRRARRLSPYVKFTLAAAALALRDAGLTDQPEILSRATALLGSMHGSPNFCSDYYAQLVKEGPLAANPVLFAEGVPNVAAAHVSSTFGIKGACQSIIGTRTSGLDALALAALRVQAGESDLVLVGAAEEHHPIIERAYGELLARHGYRERSACEMQRGFRVGHGGIAFIIESSDSAVARGVTPYARIDDSLLNSTGTQRVVASMAATLTRLDAPGQVIGSACGTWIDRAEALGLRRARVSSLLGSPPSRFGELFAATPLVGIADVLATGSLRVGAEAPHCSSDPVAQFISLCTDWTGALAVVKITKLQRSMLASF